MSIRKYVLSSSVSIVALGEPLASSSSCTVGIPVALPSVRSSSFRNSPNLRLRYLRERSDLPSRMASIGMVWLGPREIQNRYSVRLNGYLYRLPNRPVSVIQAINDSLFQCLIRIVVELVRLFSVFGLQNLFFDYIGAQITQCLLYHRWHTAPSGQNICPIYNQGGTAVL